MNKLYITFVEVPEKYIDTNEVEKVIYVYIRNE